ncbi:MAG: hypothetical protein P8J45_01055 [Phycisphaerales bacterium]|jgi:hypothetical protein|nr:hypothetical protein [Phycisphaerales bacterium]
MTLSLSTFLIGLILLLQAPPAESAAEPEANWYRGNTHTHTLWSDGDAPPEHAVKWYVDNDYDFLVLSDHNLMQQGEKWFKVEEGGRLTPSKVAEVETDFGTEWVKTRESEGATEMRLRTLDELKAHFDKPDAFLLIPGEEVTDKYRLAQVHINAINLESSIDPQHGDSVQETIQNNLDAIQAHGKATGRAVLGHLNHPNFQKSLGATNLANMKGEHFFEVYNGHRSVQNEQIGDRPSTETLWDRALTMRLRDGAGDGELLYGLATDDAHDHYAADAVSVPGRGWLMVRAENLDADSIVSAMKRGDFYASSGVELEAITFDGKTLEIRIKEEPGVDYVTEFLGTSEGKGDVGTPGQMLFITNMNPATYTLDGDELYVRARIRSTRLHPRPYAEGDYETAWVQPVKP